MFTKTDAIGKINRQIAEIASIRTKRRFSPDFKKWYRDTEIALEHIFGPNARHIQDFNQISFRFSAYSSSTTSALWEERFRKGLEDAERILSSMIQEIEDYWGQTEKKPEENGTLDIMERICDRFHLVVRQLRERYKNRNTWNVEDEYDVQDLLHCLLFLEFEDKCLYGLLSTTRFRRGNGAFRVEIPSKVWKGPPASNEIYQARFLSRKLLAERSNVPGILRFAHA